MLRQIHAGAEATAIATRVIQRIRHVTNEECAAERARGECNRIEGIISVFRRRVFEDRVGDRVRGATEEQRRDKSAGCKKRDISRNEILSNG
jgi:hypothetical protein